MVKSPHADLIEKFGVPCFNLYQTLSELFPPLKIRSLKHLWDVIQNGNTKKGRFNKNKNRTGRAT